MSVFTPVSYYFDYYNFVIYFEIKKWNTSSFVLFTQDSFGFWGLLWFHINLRIVFSPLKTAIGTLIGIAANL